MSLDLYTIHATSAEGEYIIQKFDTDYRCESVYALSEATCMCPQGHKPRCRHRDMLILFLKHNHLGDGWFLEWQTRLWRKPVGDFEGIGMQDPSEIAEDSSTCPSARAERAHEPSAGEALSPEAAPPPSPPERQQPASAAEAAPVSPVEAGAPIVKRRKV